MILIIFVNLQSISENQHLRNEIQRFEEENRQLNDISAISDTTPVGAVNLALQKKGKSIVQLVNINKCIFIFKTVFGVFEQIGCFFRVK